LALHLLTLAVVAEELAWWQINTSSKTGRLAPRV
jgi:hypothetical protein